MLRLLVKRTLPYWLRRNFSPDQLTQFFHWIICTMVLFGQVVVGPPGAGKTTYCHGMKMFIDELGRKCEIVNLDFANDTLPYTPAVDVRDLISLQDTMEEHQLGPNGGLVYCMEYLLANIEWLEDRLRELDTHYVIFDCPGQVELYTHHTGFKSILDTITKDLNCRLCSVHLVDAFYCCQPATFISAVLLVTSTMLRLGLPHVNVLTKVDLLPMYGPLPFKLDFFTECMNLAPLLRYLDEAVPTPTSINTAPAAQDATQEANDSGDEDSVEQDNDDDNDSDYAHSDTDNPHNTSSTRTKSTHTKKSTGTGRSALQQKFYKMSSALCEVVDDYGLVSFHPMNIEDVETVGRVLAATDNANGFSLAAYEATEWAKQQKANSSGDGSSSNSNHRNPGEASNYDLFRMAARNMDSSYSHSMDIQERYGIK